MPWFGRWSACCLVCCSSLSPVARSNSSSGVQHNHPDLVVDLGVGLYAFPMPWDHDGDGDLDLVISCSDKPFNGVYLFENPGRRPRSSRSFCLRRSLDPVAVHDAVVGRWKTARAGRHDELTAVATGDWTKSTAIHPLKQVAPIKHLRQNQWQLADYDGDGPGLIVAHESWDDFGGSRRTTGGRSTTPRGAGRGARPMAGSTCCGIPEPMRSQRGPKHSRFKPMGDRCRHSAGQARRWLILMGMGISILPAENSSTG